MKIRFQRVVAVPALALLLLIPAIGYLAYNRVQKQTVKHSEHPRPEPNDWMAMQRLYPYGRINPASFRSAVEQTRALMDMRQPRSNPWVFAGPDNIGGRITDIESPAGAPSTMYVGAATGGILKTTDNGLTWSNLFADVPVVSVGDIAIDPNHSNVIYCGTGEANSSSFSFLGSGIYKSTDEGATWWPMGLEGSAYIARVIVDYSDSQRLFAAACGNLFSTNDERGVYRSTDGGQNWQRVLYLTDSTAAIDLVQHPVNPQILYAAMWERVRGLTYRQSFGETSGIWRSSDGGTTWSELTNGLPSGSNVGRIGIDISRSNPDILYAFYDLSDSEVGVYKTTNGGLSWVRTTDWALAGMNSNFGWYFGQARVDPVDPNRVYVMGVSLFTTDDGGSNWTDIGTWDIHVDHHAMFFDRTNNRIIEGNDGGLYTSENHGSTWNKINNLPLTQFYAIEVDHQNPQRIYGGTQDNNTVRTWNGGVSDWEPILGGDGMYTLVDYTNPMTIYAEYQWGNLYRSDDGGSSMNYLAGPMSGDRVNWSAPLAMHPTDPSILYFGTYRVWKSTDRGDSWQAVSADLTGGINQYFYSLTTISISPVDPSIIFAGSGDGKVHVSVNDGQTWQDISAGLPDRWVTKVAADPFDSHSIYVTLSGFRWDEPLPHVFKSSDLGATWTNITGNLPEFPVNDIAIDPDLPGRLIVATDAGLYGTTNGGQYWYWIFDSVPAVPVYTLKIHGPTRTIVAGTYGLSCYKAPLDDLMTGLQPESERSTLHLQAAPNPVQSATTLYSYIPVNDDVTITASAMSGKIMETIFTGKVKRGKFTHSWNTSAMPAGVYIVRMKGARISGSIKIIKF